MKSFYDILGVSKFATNVEIKKAYILRSKMMHPDRFNQNSQKEEWSMANEMLKELNHAYGVLKDPVSRSTYDRTMGGGYSQQSSPPPQSSTRSSSPPNSEAEPSPIRKKQQYQSPPRIVPDISHWIYILLFFGVLGYFMVTSWIGGKPTSPQATKNAGITSPPRQKYTPLSNAVFGLDAEIPKAELPEGCVEDFSNTLEAQKALKTYQKQLETLNTGPISGWIIRLNPFNSDASSVDLMADSLIPTLARGLHGRFLESDFALYNSNKNAFS
jgi:curved DNA-binding protein CbpA